MTVPELLPKPTIVRRLVGRKPDANPSLTLSRGLRTHRIPLCLSILDLTKGNEKYARWFRESNLTEEEFAVRNFGIFVDCLDLLCSTSDEVYRYLFIGEVVKTAHVPLESLSELAAVRVHFTGLVTEAFKSYCRRVLDPAAQEMLASELDSIHDFLSAPSTRKMDLLLIGDCFFLEVASFLAAPMLKAGIELNPTYGMSMNPVEMRSLMRKHARNKWAAVFYSPFTYTASEHYSRSLKAPYGIAYPKAISEMVEPSLAVIRGHLDVLATEFDCPIFVHNSANVRRHNSQPVNAMKMVLSRRTRERVRKAANRRIEAYIDEVNAATFPHVHLFDEHNLLSQASEWVLGRRLYDSHVQHPTVLSRMVAERYRDLLEMLATLATKKLVVCDLDNTLWEGEIGEGAVRHHRDRQAILKRLRSQGVLLAINSRNDPKNVHWRDAVLDESDFVAAEINWDAKPNNMKRIQQKLNLKTKDFVFIDDRADQRALVSEVFPDIHVMDAISERSWKLLDLWSQLIRPGDEADRTQFYREREEREKFLGGEAAEHDPAALMAGLGLRANVRFAGRSDLERVVELINRTNQFNLNGTRTSFREAHDWIATPGRRILVIDGADKFGQMGLICVAYVDLTSTNVQIPTFVLSCRVFGYGFETAMLNAIGRLVWATGGESPREAAPSWVSTGRLPSTGLAEPCTPITGSSGAMMCGSSTINPRSMIPPG